MLRALIRGLAVCLCSAIAAATATAADSATAIITRDHVSLRAAPRGSGQQQAVLWQGEMVEVRGERMDYLQVYDYRRERGGFVHVSQARRLKLTAEEAPELLSIVRFVRETPGGEALGIGFAMAYIQAAPAEMLRSDAGIEALDALGTFADRLARRASSGIAQSKAAETTLSAHLDVAARYGIKFSNHERKGRMQICYDGDAFRRVLTELAGVKKSELTDEDLPRYNDAAMRVNASRWAAAPAAATAKRAHIVTVPGQPGETCISLVDAKNDAGSPLARRCTYGVVWTGSATLNREGNALALAVQTMDTWREMWVFRKEAAGWTIRVLPPAATMPDIGYAEFAGWVPGGKQMLVAREASGEGKYQRNFEVMRLDTLAVAYQSSDPGAMGMFQRWQDPSWKQQTLSVR